MYQSNITVYFPSDGSPSLNLTLLCFPSQKGLFFDFPHLHNVILSLASYRVPSADSSAIPPLAQIGPLVFACGSSTNPSEGAISRSIGFTVLLSQATSLPEVQSQASRMARSFALTAPHVILKLPGTRKNHTLRLLNQSAPGRNNCLYTLLNPASQ